MNWIPARVPPSITVLALEAADALCAWESGYQRGATGIELRRLRLTYYDLRLLLVERVGRAMGLILIEQALVWEAK